MKLSIRAKVALLSLLLALIPLVGYGYVREMENFMRSAQEQAVVATARAVATAMHDRSSLLPQRSDGDESAPVAGPVPPEIELIVRGLRRTSSRIWVVDRHRRLLALEGSLRQESAPLQEAGWERALRPIYALLLERPREDFDDALPESALSEGREVDAAMQGVPATRWRQTSDRRAVILSAAHPIWNGPEVVGAVVVEETTNAVLSLRNRVFEQLLTVTLAVFLLGAGGLFLFASRLSARLRRLRDDAENAIDAKGRVRRPLRASQDGDEIGDLSRSFSTLLDRLGDYTAYLERMADRLSHELRTPVAVVSSSLDNLKAEAIAAPARVYIDRAEEGLRRLNTILTRITEATRLERMLADAEREPFDLGRVVSGCVAGYTAAFPQHRFQLVLPERRIELNGAPDLIAQLLDKLVENAMDFTTPGEPIEIAVTSASHAAHLSVANPGPPLPEAMQGRLFESMVTLRDAGAAAAGPHLGLGLFIVRLIAEFHGGRARARNREDGHGVIVDVEFPLRQIALKP